MASKASRRQTDSVVALHSVGPTGKPRFDGALLGSVLVALIEAAKEHAYEDPCATLDVLAVAGRFAVNIREGLDKRQTSISVDDLALAMAMLRQTANYLEADGRDDDVADDDDLRTKSLYAAADILEEMLLFVQ